MINSRNTSSFQALYSPSKQILVSSYQFLYFQDRDLHNIHRISFYFSRSKVFQTIMAGVDDDPGAEHYMDKSERVGVEFMDVQPKNSKSRGGGKGGRRGGKSSGGPASRAVGISKALSKILRHDAVKEGLKLDAEGYAKVDELVSLF
jgi:hypothetical protein